MPTYQKPVILAVEGSVMRIQHPSLPGQPKTVLTSASSASGTSLTVSDNNGLTNGDWIRLGSVGSERSEMVRVNAAVTRGTALTTTTQTFDHPEGTGVEKILFDQWRLYGNSTNSTSGATLIDTFNIRWDEPETTYAHTGTEQNYYFVIGYNSNSASTFTYSDGIPKDSGWVEGTVGSVIESAFETTGINRRRVSNNWLLKEINDCMRYVTGKLRRWSFLQIFDYSIGSVVQGTYKFTMPTDIEDPNSAKSILGFRIGEGEDLIYIDKEEWEARLKEVAFTEVRTQALAGDTTLAVNNSYDFTDTGSVDIFVNGAKQIITYTGVTRSTTAGVLTGIPTSGTGSITATITVNSGVWQRASEGSPTYFTAYDGVIKFWPLADASHDYKNAYLDYYSKKTSVDSYADVIEGPRYDAVKYWLEWKLRNLNNPDGKLDMKDGSKLMFDNVVTDLIRMDDSGQKNKWRFNPNGISY